jgi:hypothetical protein
MIIWFHSLSTPDCYTVAQVPLELHKSDLDISLKLFLHSRTHSTGFPSIPNSPLIDEVDTEEV